MLAKARARLVTLPAVVSERVELVECEAVDAPGVLGGGRFDVVLCHGVLPYVPAAPTLAALVTLAARDGVLSVVTGNRRALALRPGLGGRWAEALRGFDEPTYHNALGIDARADDPDDIGSQLADLGAETLAWYGVRLFTDPLRSDTDLLAAPDAFEQILSVEWEAGRRDPYRQLCRLFHLIAQVAT